MFHDPWMSKDLRSGQPSAVNLKQSARWVLLHLIRETVRHAGHAGHIREALDGRRAPRLLAATKPDGRRRSLPPPDTHEQAGQAAAMPQLPLGGMSGRLLRREAEASPAI